MVSLGPTPNLSLSIMFLGSKALSETYFLEGKSNTRFLGSVTLSADPFPNTR